MFVEYFDLKRAGWDAEIPATILTRLHDSGYQSLTLDIHQLIGPYTHSRATRKLSEALSLLDPFTDVLLPPVHRQARVILHRPDPLTFRVVAVGRSQQEVRMAATGVKMHLEAALGGRIGDLVVDENGRVSLAKFRQEVLAGLGFTGDGASARQTRHAGAAPLLTALQHQPVFQGVPTVMGSQLATLAPDRPAEQTRDALEHLVSDGAVVRWYVVVCRESGQVLTFSPSQDEVKTFAALNLSCPHCGKRVSEDQTDIAYRLGAEAQGYLSDNRWICDLIETPLRRQGVEAVVMEPGKGPVDGAACYHSALLLFRAKEGPAAVGDLTGLKTEARRLEGEGWPVHPMLVSTVAAPADVRDAGVTVVDNVASLEGSLETVLREVRERSLNALLPGLLRPAAVALADLLPIDAS